ncbi:MAG TPA: DUF58 domain-containing protein [Mycetocola sp.]|jgi:uncharacterized protein (DUF58 family)|uniref:DUF58 domain-containing protein n=1 Tax=Mycetocola sp. TaxID=1871042 RepID=UPI00262519BE|nr:DUF58 domain-containing protein [Mycetocola sp.]MCU1419142.1 hypothetical protein [Mycetocola sp.]MCU1560046.1 hypothetical protein [Mycetocola sp.]HEV7849655.1 DUF58 domain-containing protein [Mycetocola sp.]
MVNRNIAAETARKNGTRLSRADAPGVLGETQLINARTRLVGARQGRLADTVVAVVRSWRRIRRVARSWWEALAAVVTPLGWGIAVSVVVAFLAGYGLGWLELVAVGWAGLLVIVAAVLFLIGRTSHDATLSIPVNRVVAGESAVGQLTVTNPTRRLLPGTRIEVPVGEGLADFQLPALAPSGRYEDLFTVPALHRGVIPVGPVRAVRADPIGLVRRERGWDEQVDLFVHPRTISVASMSSGFVHDLEGNATRDLTDSDVSFHALREYMPGDAPRSIHWKSTAKTGQYMVRQFEETRRSHLMLAISLAEEDYAGDEDFEMAVSVVGSLGVRAIRDGRTISVVASESTPEFASRRLLAVKNIAAVSGSRLLDDLSRIDRSETALPLVDLARVAADSIAGISLAFLVCGAAVSVSSLRHAASHFPVGVEVIAVVSDPEAVPSFKRAGELTVLRIGYLEDLQQSMARASA